MSGGKLRQIQDRIKSLKSTNKITKAMQLIASTKLASAKKKLGNSEHYYQEIKDLGQMFVINEEEKIKMSSQRYQNVLIGYPKGRDMLIVISPDKGLCGNVNSMIKKALDKYLERRNLASLLIFAVGKKIIEYIQKNYPEANLICNEGDPVDNVDKLFSEYKFKRVDILYSHFTSIISNVPKVIHAFPALDSDVLKKEKLEHRPIMLKSTCIIEQKPELFIKAIAGLLLKACIRHCLNSAYLSEVSSRMTAMDAATRNSKKMIDSFSLQRNKLRQAKITNELIDIVSGANAV